MELALTMLPIAAFLVCPLMMAVCLIGMRRRDASAPSTAPAATEQTQRERIVALERQLARSVGHR